MSSYCIMKIVSVGDIIFPDPKKIQKKYMISVLCHNIVINYIYCI